MIPEEASSQIELAPLPRKVRNTFCPTHPGGKAAAAATRLLDLSEINNLVKSQDRAGAREGAPGETSTTTRAEKKRKPVSLVHQAPAGWFSAL